MTLFPPDAEQPMMPIDPPEATIPPTGQARIIVGDAERVLRTLPSASVRTCITSPPYWGLRDYGISRDAQIGAEEDLSEYISRLVAVFEEVRRALTDDGTLWLNLGNSYTSGNRTWRATDKKNPARQMEYRPPTPLGLKPKDLVGIPWMMALALQARGWYLRSDIIWYKPNCQPESVRDRPTQSHEYLFLLSKSERYFYNASAVLETSNDGRGRRNRRTVWSIPTEPFPEAHFATFPPSLVAPCVLAGSQPGDTVLDPFLGAGTAGMVARELQRSFIGIDINPAYAQIAAQRIGFDQDEIVVLD